MDLRAHPGDPWAPTLVGDPGRQRAAEGVRDLLAGLAPPERVRERMEGDDPYDPDLWRALVTLGPVTSGPVGARAGVFEELGRSLAPTPLLGTTMAAAAVAAAGGPAAAELVAALEAGTPGALAVVERSLGVDPHHPATTARPAGSGRWVVSGFKRAVIDAPAADVVVVLAATGSGPRLLAVDGPARAPGLTWRPLPALDLTRRLADLELVEVVARPVGPEDAGAEAATAALDLAATVLAAEQVGGAQRCLDLTLDHARHRHQFGRPIGSFQAVQHRCAELFVTIELARSTALAAAWAADHDPADLAIAGPTARVVCSAAYLEAAATCLQVHGARAMTWDHEAHLHLKRAKSSSLVLGDEHHWRGLLADRLGL